MDPESGKCVFMKAQVKTPVTKLQEAINEAQEGRFHPDREKDELSKALKNPKHPGRTQGTLDSILWKYGFPDNSATYRSRGRMKKEAEDQMLLMEQRLAKLEELESQRATSQPS